MMGTRPAESQQLVVSNFSNIPEPIACRVATCAVYGNAPKKCYIRAF